LITPNEVTSAALPSLIVIGTHSMFAIFEVNGLATDASAFDSEMPALAAFSAPQSLAPSPHIPTKYLYSKLKKETINVKVVFHITKNEELLYN
jgi:hypothetical protein